MVNYLLKQNIGSFFDLRWVLVFNKRVRIVNLIENLLLCFLVFDFMNLSSDCVFVVVEILYQLYKRSIVVVLFRDVIVDFEFYVLANLAVLSLDVVDKVDVWAKTELSDVLDEGKESIVKNLVDDSNLP